MKSVYIVVSRADSHIKKPFLNICKTEDAAKSRVASIKVKATEQERALISYKSVEVSDFDANKSTIYVVYDKTDANVDKPFVSMHFDYQNVEKRVKELRAKVSPHAQKLIFVKTENLV